jgi:GNAT superfamily N-acetyltransferase
VSRHSSEKIVFRDALVTHLRVAGAVVRRIRVGEAENVFTHHREPVGDYILEVDGVVVATGGLTSHYNPPYRDVYMEVEPRFRLRGYGSYLVQELKALCYESGGIPCA